ncbi:MAG: hypothetical protein PHV53_11355 [Fermentimonas sp.]|nr:hypothetical protein [Fermentimonas sp.]
MEKVYENYCVAFIDILGFKEMTSSVERLNTYTEICEESIYVMKDSCLNKDELQNVDSKRIISIQGADSIFFIFPAEPIYIFTVIHRIRLMQFRLALIGVYIRGAICSGTMYINEEDNIYFGDAWNKAVREEQQAQSPRIIIENKLVRILKAFLESINESVFEYVVDNDGFYIVPPYYILGGFELNRENSPEELYEKLFIGLAYNAKINSKSTSILQKYLWIAKQIEKAVHSKAVREKAQKSVGEILEMLHRI